MIKRIIIGGISIVLSCLLFFLVGCFILSYTVFSKKYVKDTLDKNDYYHQTYVRIQDEFSGYAPQLHIGDEVINLSDICTEEMVTLEIHHLIDSIYDHKEVQVDTSLLNANLDQKIQGMLSQYGKVVSSSEKEALDEWKRDVLLSYQNEILYSYQYVAKLPDYYVTIHHAFCLFVKVVLFVFLAFFLFFILLQKTIKGILRNLGIVFLSTGFLFFIVRFLYLDRVSHILVLSERASAVFIYILRDILHQSFLFGILLGIIGFIGIILGIEDKDISSSNDRKGKVNFKKMSHEKDSISS